MTHPLPADESPTPTVPAVRCRWLTAEERVAVSRDEEGLLALGVRTCRAVGAGALRELYFLDIAGRPLLTLPADHLLAGPLARAGGGGDPQVHVGGGVTPRG